MAFDQSTRNRMQRFVSEARGVLTEEFTRQLQNDFGLDPASGQVAPLDSLRHLDDARRETARILRETLAHYLATSPSDGNREALDRIVREQSFTVLNRLAALRMAEARGLLIESVGAAYNSKGFQLYARLAGSGLGEMGDAFRCYLFSVFDELALDLKILFDRYSPQGRLFPREPALLELLRLLNAPDIAPLWAEDETIGWIYQYFNSKEERKKMRDESAAPRNSRELAVRNQFFTPRYVVEFLTDNTLGRIWYEMTQGNTALKERCRYLVRRPHEIFLATGEAAPEAANDQENLSQAELLKQPVYIPFRALKDPREIKMLDPACGSMHFGLYSFDLFECIYEEAWELDVLPSSAGQDARGEGLKPLRETYANKDELLRDIPRLIIEHNIHGIDIDPRAVQIAGLSLWLRAQRTWQQQGLKLAERPRIRRSNIVCAEPMPGEVAFLDEFIKEHLSTTPGRKLLGQLVRRVFEGMKLGGEAGSLLKIEQDIAGAVSEAKQKWLASPKPEQIRLFADGTAPPVQQELGLDVTGITDETFWEKAEERIYAALHAYAERIEYGDGYQRRLFADDAARGFAFIDICRNRYDVVLMNPPFGDASLPSKPYVDETYSDTKGDVYKAFVECFQARLVPAGYLGIISSRTGFFLGQSEDWRTRVVLRLFRPIALADLGMGVLDAMVEVAAYVLRSLSEPEARNLTLSLVPMLKQVELDRQERFSLPKWQAARDGLKRHQAVAELEHLKAAGFIERCSGDFIRYRPLWRAMKAVTAPPESLYPPFVCIRALAEGDKGPVLVNAIGRPKDPRMFVCNPRQFSRLPGTTFAYWGSEHIFRLFERLPPLAKSGREVRTTNPTTDDFRFARAWWEPSVGHGARWRSWNKGGGFSPYYRDIDLVIDWDEERSTYRGYVGTIYRPDVRPANLEYFSRPGLTWVYRGRRLCVQAMPSGTVISTRGNGIYAAEAIRRFDLGLLNSIAADYLIKLTLGRGDHPQFDIGDINTIPVPREDPAISGLAGRAWSLRYSLGTPIETSHAFASPALLSVPGSTLIERTAAWTTRVGTTEETAAAIQTEIDDLAFRLYGLDDMDRAALTITLATESSGDTEARKDEEEEGASADAPALTADLLAYTLGTTFGRWDIRFSTGEKPAPELPDPFAPLPVCPPGQLQNEQGLPITREEVAKPKKEGRWNYPIEIPWDGILVDDPAHPLDIEARIHQVLQIIWKDRWEAIEREACEILGVRTLRDYFRKPAGFFADHLKRYSKSRRQAPIYWPLSTASGSYTLWIYYHRLTDQTLYTCIVDFVEPKLRQVSEAVGRLQAKGSARSRSEEKDLEALQDFVAELQTFRDELLTWAPRWKPNLNDGVQITAAPLWKLFRLPKWQKTLKETWEKLESGDYDWAHLAYTLWPDRVRKKCKTDKSLAIAHGLDDLYQEPPPSVRKKRGRRAAEEGMEDA